MALIKRCFICAHKQNEDGSCTNPDCPRYVPPVTNTAANTTSTTADANK
ncbi:hypothetical protein [Pectinatus frisingensis]|nr:hypothetical protein [Pectinatus frisingensis]